MNYFLILGAALVYCTIFVNLIRSTHYRTHEIRCYVSGDTVVEYAYALAIFECVSQVQIYTLAHHMMFIDRANMRGFRGSTTTNLVLPA